MDFRRILLFLSLVFLLPRSYSLLLNVKDFGAKGGGKSDDTKAFGSAWKAACASSKPATIVVPAGTAYRLKPITFPGPCNSKISLMIEGTILASEEISDWNKANRRVWIVFDGVDNLSVNGGGTIDGNGQAWWKLSCKIDPSQPCKGAPTAMTFLSCKHLSVKNINFKNSQQMHLTISESTGVRISKLRISAPDDSPNTDGIHVSDSIDVEILDSVIGTGDDCISIVNGSRFIKANNIVCGPGHGISIGSLGANGAKESVSDILVDTARLVGATNGVRIKTWQGGKGYARNITFKNIVMDNVKNPIIIDQNYCDSSKPCSEQSSAVAVSGVTYKNIKGTSANKVAMDFDCSRAIPCRGITLQNVHIMAASGEAAKSLCRNVNLSKYGTVIPSVCSS